MSRHWTSGARRARLPPCSTCSSRPEEHTERFGPLSPNARVACSPSAAERPRSTLSSLEKRSATTAINRRSRVARAAHAGASGRPWPGCVCLRYAGGVFQLAYSFDEISLAEIAYEMTGTYGIAPWEDDGAHARLEPLVDVAGLCGYATSARLLGVRGARRACAALDIVVPGSNSPRETDTAIFLSLGRGRGGLGAAGFKMNAPVALPDRLASMVGQKRSSLTSLGQMAR